MGTVRCLKSKVGVFEGEDAEKTVEESTQVHTQERETLPECAEKRSDSKADFSSEDVSDSEEKMEEGKRSEFDFKDDFSGDDIQEFETLKKEEKVDRESKKPKMDSEEDFIELYQLMKQKLKEDSSKYDEAEKLEGEKSGFEK